MPSFYITTAIDYANGSPHLGHAYEKVLTDVIARFRRQMGDRCIF
jgi:methionyl-tRNA synthetase